MVAAVLTDCTLFLDELGTLDSHHCKRGWNAQVPAINGIEERKCRTWGGRSALMCLMDPSIGCSGAERPDDVLVTLEGNSVRYSWPVTQQ